MSTLEFGPEHCGPDGSANGGWSCGALTGRAERPMRVRLSRPVPLERPLRIVEEGSTRTLMDGEDVIASAMPDDEAPQAPPFVHWETADKAESGYPGGTHPFPRCLVCGDELRDLSFEIHAGKVRDLFAGTYVPRSGHVEDGVLLPEAVGAALDCAGGWTAAAHGESAAWVLGTLVMHQVAQAPGDTRYVVTARCDGIDGRKARVRTGLYQEDGTLIAAARAVWIRVS